MPYIIHEPRSGRVYVTNNPIIFMDCRTWGWEVESRRYADKECRNITDREDKYDLGEQQERALEKLWSEEMLKRKLHAEVEDTAAKEIQAKAVKEVVGMHTQGAVKEQVTALITKRMTTVVSVLGVPTMAEDKSISPEVACLAAARP